MQLIETWRAAAVREGFENTRSLARFLRRPAYRFVRFSGAKLS